MASSGRPFKSNPKVEELAFDIEKNDNEKVKSILKEVGIDATDSYLRTSLIWAAFYNKIDLVIWLIENGADINHQDKNGLSALHFAAKENRTEVVKLLIEKNANIEIKDQNGNTPLMDAIFNSRDNLINIELFLKSGANLDNENNHEMTPRLLAESMFHSNEIEKIENWTE
ncbi:Ankyrin repeat [Flavobacterium succinicans]|uniref:Ankyrin repeat n=1 Tax=Flavobacterium succinicans TaxID=29536 RepID=A0A1I5AD50_9FLAO|nr:ankyrin repeat domain-containing protein [Flavobacterium succinicans]SFN60290.1 Ankyrin repeat [Flavobacterium succinicans]